MKDATGEGRAPVLVEEDVRAVMDTADTNWVVTVATALSALAAWVALGFSIYNAYARRRDRKPRVEIAASWIHPREAPMAIRGTANPTAGGKFERWKAIYQCEITNVGIAGVKIRQVNVYPQAPPGRPMPLSLPQGEQPRKLDNGDSQTWTLPIDDVREFPPHPNPRVPTQVVAVDTVGNAYKAKDPAPFPYPYDWWIPYSPKDREE